MGTNYKDSQFQTDAVLTSLAAVGISPDTHAANIARSGQLGTGIRFTKLDGATPAVFNPVVAVVLNTPSMWATSGNMSEMVRALVETHAKSITGIDFGYRLETGDSIVGNDGQSMKTPTRSTRSEVSPSFTFQEYIGNPVWNIIRQWIYDIQHPDTNASIIPAVNTDSSTIPAWVMSTYSMSVLFIQYDPTGLPDRIQDAYIVTNMFPTETGDAGFERTIGTTKLMERTINFTGLVQHNENTRELGVQVATMLNLHKINYNFALPGLTGSADTSTAIQSDLAALGGINYEANGNGSVDGATKQFVTLNTDADSAAYTTEANIASTGAAAANMATSVSS